MPVPMPEGRSLEREGEYCHPLRKEGWQILKSYSVAYTLHQSYKGYSGAAVAKSALPFGERLNARRKEKDG